MAGVFLTLIIWALVLEPSCRASVFLPQSSADDVLQRQKRHNSGFLEEMRWGNLERECLEERCDLEEAREVFENMEKTMAFWVSYIDVNQCLSSPCQNGGECKDGLRTYLCSCLTGFTGRNCEIELIRQCDINNGGCMHFCEVDQEHGRVCNCATGHRLAEDGKSCEPEGEFPCGKPVITAFPVLSSRSLLPVELNSPPLNTTDHHVNTTANAANATNTTTTTAPPTTTATAPPTTDPTPSPSNSKLPLWFIQPTLPTVIQQQALDQRIVGGNDVIQGEIPWQVALVDKPSQVVFCGGSILSEHWVITAAHCLVEGREDALIVRVGEHNVHYTDGREQDHEVAEWRPHPLYNPRMDLYNHDIALLRMRSPIRFTDYVRPVCLGPKVFTEALVEAGSMARVSGWGRLRFQGTEATVLQKVELPFVDRTECKDSSSDRISRYMFCAGYYDQGKDSCQGDSGGPHTNRYHDTWFLTGIVSWGEECAKEGKYGVYTRVSHYYRWIRCVTGVTKDVLGTDVPDPL
ncbi:hypothetical protein AAFF_G00288920 [Aldrovandia affinis]|uniref:Coagulation factor IX n=1 Tax=Aldrovandia affinis TaxID=143900 RepID=A0AAD7WRY4_9TELE|nr:hypothetical protein AAFF_G00288920 [Aldrovandia affinis]